MRKEGVPIPAMPLSTDSSFRSNFHVMVATALWKKLEIRKFSLRFDPNCTNMKWQRLTRSPHQRQMNEYLTSASFLLIHWLWQSSLREHPWLLQRAVTLLANHSSVFCLFPFFFTAKMTYPTFSPQRLSVGLLIVILLSFPAQGLFDLPHVKFWSSVEYAPRADTIISPRTHCETLVLNPNRFHPPIRDLIEHVKQQWWIIAYKITDQENVLFDANTAVDSRRNNVARVV